MQRHSSQSQSSKLKRLIDILRGSWSTTSTRVIQFVMWRYRKSWTFFVLCSWFGVWWIHNQEECNLENTSKRSKQNQIKAPLIVDKHNGYIKGLGADFILKSSIYYYLTLSNTGNFGNHQKCFINDSIHWSVYEYDGN